MASGTHLRIVDKSDPLSQLQAPEMDGIRAANLEPVTELLEEAAFMKRNFLRRKEPAFARRPLRDFIQRTSDLAVRPGDRGQMVQARMHEYAIEWLL